MEKKSLAYRFVPIYRSSINNIHHSAQSLTKNKYRHVREVLVLGSSLFGTCTSSRRYNQIPAEIQKNSQGVSSTPRELSHCEFVSNKLNVEELLHHRQGWIMLRPDGSGDASERQLEVIIGAIGERIP